MRRWGPCLLTGGLREPVSWRILFSCLQSFASRFRDEGVITADQHARILQNIEKLKLAIESSEKTKNWVKRAKIGTSKPWYREVEDLSL